MLVVITGIAIFCLGLWQTAPALAPGGTGATGFLESSLETVTEDRAAADQPSDDDSPGHETEDPGPPDHGTGTAVQVDLAGGDLVTIGRSHAQTEEDGSSSGDVTVLAIAGSEIVGAHSDSKEGPEEDRVDPLAPLCEGSGGSVCVQLLFASTSSTDNHAESHAALVFVCVGGSNPAPNAECDGLVQAGVSESHAQTTTDPSTGGTTSDGEAVLADVCLGGEDPATGTCTGVGAAVAQSESHAEAGSQTGEGTASRRSVIAVEAGGEEAISISDPTAITVPPDCPDSGSVICLFLNQGETATGIGSASASQEGIHIDLLKMGDTTILLGHVGDTEALATAGPVFLVPRVPPPLAVTGLEVVPFLWAGLALLGIGAAVLVWDRRRIAVR
jgi:hypothetical protein